MVFYKFKPKPSSRMAVLNTVATIRESILLELGSIEDLIYSSIFVGKASIDNKLKFDFRYDEECNLMFGGVYESLKKLELIISKNKPKVIFIMNTSDNLKILGYIDEIVLALGRYKDIQIVSLGDCFAQDSFNKTMENTLLKLVASLAREDVKKDELSFNILGSCMDMFKFKSDIEEIVRILDNVLGLRANCILTSDTSIENIEDIGRASINLVIREEALKTAEFLENKYKTPFLYDRPYGIKGSIRWIEKIGQVLNLDINRDYIDWEMDIISKELDLEINKEGEIVGRIGRKKKISVGGHRDIVLGVSSFAIDEFGLEKGVIWRNNDSNIEDELDYIMEEEFFKKNLDMDKHILMASGELIEAEYLAKEFQISNPDTNILIDKDEKTLVGFKGAINLMKIWSDNIE